MKKLILTDKLDALRVAEDTSHLVPRHLKLPLKTCCDEAINSFQGKFMDTTPETRDLILILTAPGISSKTTTLSRRDYYRKQAMVRTEFIPADTSECCREKIGRFLNLFRGWKPGQRELIIHVIKGGSLSSFNLCCRRTAGLWIQEVIDRNSDLAFLEGSTRHPNEPKFSNEPVSDSNDTVYELEGTGDEDDYDFFNS